MAEQNVKLEKYMEDRLFLLRDRLENSLYLEDKIESLEKILDISENYLFLVGVHCLDVITESMNETKSCGIQKIILKKIFTSKSKFEFLEIFLKKEKNLETLINHMSETLDLLSILSNFNPFLFYTIIYRCKLIYRLYENIEISIKFLKFIINDNNNNLFMIEGFLERILEIINDSNSKDCIDSLCKILKNNVTNQNYFLELKFEKVYKYKPFSLYLTLIDFKNQNLKFIQNMFCRIEFIDLENLEFLRKIIYKNPENLLKIEELGFDYQNTVQLVNSNNDINSCLQYLMFLETYQELKQLNIDDFDIESKLYYHILSIILIYNIKDDNFDKITSKEFFDEFLFKLSDLKNESLEKFSGYILFLYCSLNHKQLDYYALTLINEILKDSDINHEKKLLAYLIVSKCDYNLNIFKVNNLEVCFHLNNFLKILNFESFIFTEKSKLFLQREILGFFEMKNEKNNLRNEYLEIKNKKKEEILEVIQENIVENTVEPIKEKEEQKSVILIKDNISETKYSYLKGLVKKFKKDKNQTKENESIDNKNKRNHNDDVYDL